MNPIASVSPAPRRLLPASLVLLGLAYLVMLFFRGFADPDEGRYAEVAREMAVSGHWGEMRMMGYRYYEKPPLTYWMIAPAIAACGARDWAVRIPLLLNIALTALLFHLLVRRFWPGAAGRAALPIMLSSAGFMVGFCLLITDGFLTLWFSLTCGALLLAFQPGARPAARLLFSVLAAVAAACGLLTKGAVAFVLPAIILLAWLIFERRARDLWTLAVPAAGLVFLALAVPLLLAVERYNPGFIRHFIFDEHIARFTGTRSAQLHPEPFWFYLAVLLPMLLPWTLFLPRAIRFIAVRRLPATDPLTCFCALWAGVVLVFFSCATGKLMSYILPAIPPLALIIGRWGVAEPPDGTRRDRRLWNLGMAGLLLTLLALPAVWLASYFKFGPPILAQAAGVSALALIPALAAAAVVAASCSLARVQGALALAAALLCSCALLLSPLAGKDFNVLLHLNSSHVFKALAARLQPEDRVIVLWDYRPALPFYTRRLPYFFQMKNELEFGILMERGRGGYLHFTEDLRRAIREAPGRVYVVIEPQDYERKFLPLKLNFRPLDELRDRDTIVFEIAPDSPAR